jgi:hypothetical protein
MGDGAVRIYLVDGVKVKAVDAACCQVLGECLIKVDERIYYQDLEWFYSQSDAIRRADFSARISLICAKQDAQLANSMLQSMMTAPDMKPATR